MNKMTPRSRKYFQKKEYDKGMLDAMYCTDCQALSEYDCLCEWREYRDEMREMEEYDDWESITDEWGI